MNKTWVIIIAIVVIVGGIYLFTRAPKTNDTSTPVSQETENMRTQGRVVFSVTDAAANMSTISEINMKVSKVEMHNQADGWFTISTTPRTYNLLALNASGESKILADAQVTAYEYDQIRLMVDSISVKTKAGATSEAKLPSGELKINTKVVVNTGTTSSVNLDFLADKSLHVTGNGKYIFAPVVKAETRSNTNVSVGTNSTVSIAGGKVDDDETIGMDIDGSVKANFQINGSQKLNIGTDNVIKIEL